MVLLLVGSHDPSVLNSTQKLWITPSPVGHVSFPWYCIPTWSTGVPATPVVSTSILSYTSPSVTIVPLYLPVGDILSPFRSHI